MAIPIDRFTTNAQNVIQVAQDEAEAMRVTYIGTEHILLGLLKTEDGHACRILNSLAMDYDKAKEEILKKVNQPKSRTISQIVPSKSATSVIRLAAEEAERTGVTMVDTEHLLLGLLLEGEGTGAQVLKASGITLETIREALQELLVPVGAESGAAPRTTPAINQFSRDLTDMARKGQLDPMTGRGPEVERAIQILSRRTKNNPVLIGEPGVGKTAIVEGLAQMIVNCEVPANLLGKRLLALDLGAVVAGTKLRGEFEERIGHILREARKSKDIILFIDELHTLVGSGSAMGSLDGSNMLKPALARGEVHMIGATTLDEYRKYIEKDAALERRLQPIFVEPPTNEMTLDILKGNRKLYERYHKVKISDEALETAVRLADRYVKDRLMPDKAIDLIDEASARVRVKAESLPPELLELVDRIKNLETERTATAEAGDYENATKIRSDVVALREEFDTKKAAFRAGLVKKVEPVEAENIAEIVSTWTGVPVTKLAEGDRERLLHMEESLHQRVIGQDEAIEVISRAVRRTKAGLSDGKRPIGSFMFLGPTGVGKTELAKTLAEFLFDDENKLIRLDMSEFQEPHTVSRLTGAPPGYIGYDQGGQLTEAVRTNPYSVVLFDEIEKAHPDVFNILLQILEDGGLSDARGRRVDFSNTVVLMTSNIGADKLAGPGRRGIGFHTLKEVEGAEHKRNLDLVMGEVKHLFRPELLNRIDGLVCFDNLTMAQLTVIADKMLNLVSKQLAEKEISLEVSDAAKQHLIAEGFDPKYGARPLRRVIEKEVSNSISELLLTRRANPGSVMKVDFNGDEIVTQLESKEIEKKEEEVSVASEGRSL